jgi:hypothetical protein
MAGRAPLSEKSSALAVDDLVLTSRAIPSGIDKSHLEGGIPVAGWKGTTELLS